MNNRIKKKINKRIMNNIKKGKNLSEFDKKSNLIKNWEKRLDEAVVLGVNHRKPIGLLSKKYS